MEYCAFPVYIQNYPKSIYCITEKSAGNIAGRQVCNVTTDVSKTKKLFRECMEHREVIQ